MVDDRVMVSIMPRAVQPLVVDSGGDILNTTDLAGSDGNINQHSIIIFQFSLL